VLGSCFAPRFPRVGRAGLAIVVKSVTLVGQRAESTRAGYLRLATCDLQLATCDEEGPEEGVKPSQSTPF
jgi:hypothetical protein